MMPTGRKERIGEPPSFFSSMLLILLASTFWCSRFSFAEEPSFSKAVAPFLNDYCYRCHGPDKQSGDRRFDQLGGTIADDNTLVDYQDILDQLNLAEMPPDKAEQPTAHERLEVIGWLTRCIADYHALRQPGTGTVALRRLNAREYRNTIRDLFKLKMTMFDPTAAFPRDQTVEHLDNVAEALVTSGYLLARYLESAEQIVDKALFPLEQPEIQSWRFEDNLHQQPEIDQVFRKTHHFAHLTLFDVIGADKHEGAYAPIHAFAEGVPYDGYYDITFNAEAVNRDHPYDDAFLGIDRREPFRLGIVAGNHLVGPLHKPQPIEPLLAEVELADEMKNYTVRVWLDKGFTPRFTFRNGLMDARTLWSRVQRKYPDLFPKVGKGIVAERYNAIANGQLPQIHVDDIEICGPHYDQWPRLSQLALLGDDFASVADSGSLTESQMRKHLERFLARAYRRPAEPAEVDRVLSVIEARVETGRTPPDAYADGIKTALCSPNFLFLENGRSDEFDTWSAHTLAERLSYFVWSSMPDEELFQLAASGAILDTDILAKQLERMLADPRSQDFVNGFLDSWLTLRELGSSPPDRGDFEDYYHHDLGSAMLEETRLFTRHLLDHNLSIENFLDSDFTFVNKRLAWHYGLPVPEEIALDAGKFQLVKLDDLRRGGLLGQASVMTVTANGIDTSPVVRGVWLLENMLGTPPSPPPPDVEPLDPDVRGAQTIRDQLDKHRNNPSCYECHRKIDPLGFALENFDAVGKWRDHYSRQSAIDSSGELPNGKAFADVRGLKRVLLEQQELFARALTEKLFAFALGRRLEPRDRPAVDSLLEKLGELGYGFRDQLRLVVQSDLFRAN